MEDRIKSSPKDVFMHLLAIITLYMSAVSFGALIFQFIDRAFPDALTAYALLSASSIRWAIASLVIVFPVYVVISWSLAMDVIRHPDKRELKIRKWLLYFTLFLSSVVIIGDLVALVFNLLNGDLSTRFILKVAAILFISAAVFVYYLWNLRSDKLASEDPRMRVLVFGVIAVVVLATLYGFFVAGSPFAERLRKFDDRRVQDLQSIQWQIINYWQKKDKLPQNIENLRDDISGFIPPLDPENGAAYEYRALGNLKFELCSTFKTESITSNNQPAALPVGSYVDPNAVWKHGAARTCFERTIDPQLYRIQAPK